MPSEDGAQARRHSQYALVPANDIDAERLVDFASRVWRERPPYERILVSWWRYAAPGCAAAIVHQSTGTMVGLCAGRPSEWVVAGELRPAVSICDFFVDPRHEGKLLGRRLLRHFEGPGRLLNALSISDTAAAYLARMGWTGPFASSLMVMPLPRLARNFHRLMVRRADLDLADYAIAGGQMPETLRSDLDRIEAAGADDAPAHMRRGQTSGRGASRFILTISIGFASRTGTLNRSAMWWCAR